MYGIKFVILDAWEGNPENCKFNVQIWIKPRRGLSYAYAGIGRFCKDEADVEEYKKSILDAYYLRPRITGNDGDIEFIVDTQTDKINDCGNLRVWTVEDNSYGRCLDNAKTYVKELLVSGKSVMKISNVYEDDYFSADVVYR